MLPVATHAQTSGRFGHLTVGYDGSNVKPVNAWIPASLGYPALKNGLLSISLDEYTAFNNALIGLQLQSKVGRRVNSNTGSMRPYVFDAMIQGGYVVLHNRKLMVYPTLGIGYGVFGNHIFNTRKKYPEFVPAEPAIRENVVLINRGFVGSLAVSADYYVRKPVTARDKGFTVGLRVGYDYRPQTDRWQANEKPVTGGPDFAARGPFVKLLLGLGNVGPKQQRAPSGQ